MKVSLIATPRLGEKEGERRLKWKQLVKSSDFKQGLIGIILYTTLILRGIGGHEKVPLWE